MTFVSWSVYPKGQEFDAEYFTSEDHAVDVAYSWSADEHGQTMIVARNDIEWMEVTCWFYSLFSHTFLLKIMFRIASSITTRTKVWVSDDNVAMPAYQHAGANSEYKGFIPQKVLKNENYEMQSYDNKYQSANSVEALKFNIQWSKLKTGE